MSPRLPLPGRRGHCRLAAAACTLLLPALLVVAAACERARRDEGPTVHLAVAASLRGVMEELAGRYRELHPRVSFEIESGGSTSLARKALELDLSADVLVLADASLFDDLLVPGWSSFYVRLASERIVLAYTGRSAGHEEISPENWPQVLARPDVRVGMADPDQAPVGYRTLLCLALADLELGGGAAGTRVREKIDRRHVWADVAGLLAPLQTGAIDYAFLYGATAQEAGLLFVELPAAINLGDPARARGYARVSVRVAGRTRGQKVEKKGAPIVYGASVAAESSVGEEAGAFVALLVSKEGQEALARHGFTPLRQRALLVEGAPPPALARRLGSLLKGRRHEGRER